MISDFYPIHNECGKKRKKQQKLNDRDRRKLLFVGHIMRYCNDCRKPWLLTISEEESTTLFGVDVDSADTTNLEMVSLAIDPTNRNTTPGGNAVFKERSPGQSPYTSSRASL
jgi:hypothetical protein